MANNPFTYAEQFNPSRTQPLPSQTAPIDPVVAEIRRQREQERRLDITLSGKPDDVAQVSKLSRQAGLPPALVEDRVEDVQKRLAADAMENLLRFHPQFAQIMGEQPRTMVAAQDDTKALGLLGGAWDTLKKAPDALVSGFYGLSAQGAKINETLAVGAGDFLDTLGVMINPGSMTRGELEQRKKDRLAYWRGGVSNAVLAREAARPETIGSTQAGVLAGIESLPMSLGAMLTTVATRNPTAGASMMGVATGGEAYYDSRQAGRNVLDSVRYGATYGGIEALTEKIPVGILADAMTKKTPFGKAFLASLAADMPGEQLATFGQDLIEYAALNPDKPFSDYVASRPDAMYQTALASLTGSAVQTSVATGVQRATDAGFKLADKVSASRAAKRERAFFDQAGRAAEESKLRARDPEAYAEVLRRRAEIDGVRHVFVPGEAVLEYMQSDSYDSFSDPLYSYESEVQEAAASGGDVVLPVEFAVGTLPGTPAWQALKDDMRLSAGGMSPREAETFDEAMADVMAEMTDQMAERDRQDMAARSVREKLVDEVATKLGSSYTAPAARTMAEVTVTYLERRAQRLGEPLTGNEMAGVDIAQVLPEAAVPFAKRVEDMGKIRFEFSPRLIGAIKGVSGKSETLIDFIRRKGGVEDPGGDLRSMGAAAVKGVSKKGQAKIIRPVAQASMLGSGPNLNTLESMFDAAVSEGFFPDLYVQREEGSNYSDALDLNVFLDAIGAGLRGEHIFAKNAEKVAEDEAANVLRQMLVEAGYDPSKMSNADIADSLATLTEMAQDGGYEQLADTIDIDGVQRPTRNSEGMPLAGSEQGVRAFWAWFGDSKVVDDQGRPLVVYHGTRSGEIEAFDPDLLGRNTGAASARLGFFFSGNEATALAYVDRTLTENDRETSDGVVSGFDRIIADLANWADANAPEFSKALRSSNVLLWHSDDDPGVAAQANSYDPSEIDSFGGYLDDVIREVDSAAFWEADLEGGLGEYAQSQIDRLQALKDAYDNIDLNGTADEEAGSIVLRTYLKIEQPLEADQGGKAYRETSYFDLINQGKEGGSDGVIIRNTFDGGPKDDIYVVFDPTQIKSINNRGTFDPADPRILYQSAYHGSPHIFDKFSLDYMGTGEGAQAYGWGLYFAGRKEIAEHYRQTLRKVETAAFDRGGIPPSQWRSAEMFARQTDPSMPDQAARDFAAWNNRNDAEALTPIFAEAMASKGRLYQVEIPEDDEYLLWDKPLSEQPEKVKAALEKLGRKTEDPARWTVKETAGGKFTVYNVWGEASGTFKSRKDAEAKAATKTAEHNKLAGAVAYQSLASDMGSDRAASLALHNAGIAGIKYLDGTSRKDGDGTYNYVVFDDSRVSIQAYEQNYNDGPRGRIQFDQGRVLIELFQARNLSTYFHEFGHMALENLRADASLPNASDELKQDWQAVLDWFKSNGHDVTDQIPTEAHELWARGFERYLMEGKAPTQGLKRIFETIRGWMLSIYKTLDALRSPITPEIREVMDRLLATDEEIQAAREEQGLVELFKDAATIGISGQEFDAYKAQVEAAKGEATGELLDKTMKALRGRETAKYREMRKGVRAEVEQEVDALPLYRALRLLKDTPMSREWIEREFGAGMPALLPRRRPPIYSEEGGDPTALAEMAGFATAREMVQTLAAAEQEHREAKEKGDKRTMRDRRIEIGTDDEMNRRVGDPLNDGSIEREAVAAVHNEMQGELLATEIRILSRKTGQRPTPYRIAREWARGKVRQGSYSDEASPSAIQRHARNAAKAGREAEKAMLASKFDEAFRFKQQQMLSSALLSEAKLAHDDVIAAQRYLSRIASRRTMDGVDQEYLERAHDLLEAVDLKKRSQKAIAGKASFEEWAAAKREQGDEVITPERFNYAGENWSRMTTEAITGLQDSVKSIIHLGRRKQEMRDNKARRAFEEWKAEALQNLDDTPGRAISADLDEGKSTIRAALALGLKVENLARELDNDKPGVWTRLLVDRATEAENYRAEMRRRVMYPIAERYNSMSREDRNRLAERVTVPEMPFRSADLADPRNGEPRVMSRWEIIGIALNTGTESNLDKLARGYGVQPADIEAVLNRELTEQDWQFVQATWDALETLWPDIASAEREMSGVEPERVEVREVATPFGTLRGGYYPVVYDPAQSQVGEDNEAKAADDLFGTTTGVATAVGHTKKRTNFAAPILLSPEVVLFQHVEKVITRNAYGPWVREVLKVMRDRTIRAAFDRRMGREYREMIEPWLRRQVRSGLPNERGIKWANDLLRQTRVNMTIVSMGLRWSTGVAQTIGLANSAGRIGVNNLRKGMARVLQNPAEAAAFCFERSPEMEMRNQEMNRDTIEAFQSMRAVRTGRKGVMAEAARRLSQARAFAFWHIGLIDRYVVSLPTWMGAYEKALTEGKTDSEASAYADSMVRLSQGSGREKDLSTIQSPDSEAMRFFTMFYTPFNVLLNAQWETGRAAKRGDWRKVAAMTFWFMVATPLLDALLAGDDPEEDDEYGLTKWLARNIASYQFAGIPVIRDASNYAERKAMGEFATFNPGPLARIFDAATSTGADAWDVTFGDGEASDRWLRNAIETPGYFVGLPTGQPGATAQFIWDVNEGNVKPDGFWQWYEGLTKGRIKEDAKD